MLEHGSLTHDRRDWSEAARAIEDTTRGRIRQVSDALGLTAMVRPAFSHAVLEVARLHAADMMLAQHEARTGHRWPVEDREANEEVHHVQWLHALHVLEGTCRGEQGPE